MREGCVGVLTITKLVFEATVFAMPVVILGYIFGYLCGMLDLNVCMYTYMWHTPPL